MIELKNETIWFDQRKFEEAESLYQRSLVQKELVHASPPRSRIVDQIAKARETIKQTLEQERGQPDGQSSSGVSQRLSSLEIENQQLKEVIKNIQASLSKLEERVADIEVSRGSGAPAGKAEVIEPAKKKNDDDDENSDDDLFGSDDEEELEKIKQKRIEQYNAKKAKKPAAIAKSNIILDVKPWDDETGMAKLEECVRSVKMDGLVWGTSKLAAVGYGIKKLVITCVVEDDKVGTDDLEEAIVAFEVYVQSVDVAAFNKV